MKYEKIELDNYNLHVIKTNKFKKLCISINFRRKINKNELTKRSVLINTLIDSSKKYKNGRDIEIETENLYGISVNFNSIDSGNVSIIEASVRMLNEKYTEPGMFKKTVDFLYELLFKPNIINKEFNDKSFSLAKNIIKEEIESIKDNSSFYANIRLLEEIDKNNPIAFKKNKNDLNKITPSNLYDYYLEVINNDIVDIYLVGDITDEMIEIIKNKFKFKKRIKHELNHFCKISKSNNNLIIKEKEYVNQSLLNIGYTFNEITDFERRYVLNLLNYILGGSADSLLFNNVREKESLCYRIGSSYNVLADLLVIKAGIDKENFAKTKDLILKEIENLKQGKFSIEEIDKGKKCYINGLIDMEDSLNGTLNLYKSITNIKSDFINKRIKNINKITKNDIIALANKMSLAQIFFLEGGLNEKN